MATTRWIAVLLLALAAVGVTAGSAPAVGVVDDARVSVLAPLADSPDSPDGFSDGGDAPEGFVAVLAFPAEAGFSDGGDRPIRVFVEPDGFSDGGDAPEGFVRALAPPAPDGFSDGGDGMIAVMAVRASSGELVPVLMQRVQDSPFSPEGGDF